MSRRVLHSCGLTVVAAPADTDYTIQLENAGAGLAQCRLRGGQELTGRDIVASPGAQPGRRAVTAAISVLLSKTVGGPALPIRQQARRRSPGSITQTRNRSALAPGLIRIG